MKHLKTILFCAPLLAILNAKAQLNKQPMPANATSVGRIANENYHAMKILNSTNGNTRDSVRIGRAGGNEIDTVQETESIRQSTNTESPYKTALGVKFLWGISATGKYFLTDRHAIEGIVRYRSFGGIANDIALTGLYQYQRPIADLKGLYWLIGGGVYLGNSSIKNSILPAEYRKGTSSFYFGITGVAGLEYKFEGTPIAVSADWMPAINLNGGGFGSENGGLGVKYTF